MVQKIIEKEVKIDKNHKLTGIHRISLNGESLFALSFDHELKYAREVILTISSKALLSLSPDSILFSDPKVAELFNSTSPYQHKNYFLFMINLGGIP